MRIVLITTGIVLAVWLLIELLPIISKILKLIMFSVLWLLLELIAIILESLKYYLITLPLWIILIFFVPGHLDEGILAALIVIYTLNKLIAKKESELESKKKAEMKTKSEAVFFDRSNRITDLEHAASAIINITDEEGNRISEIYASVGSVYDDIAQINSYEDFFSWVYEYRIKELLEISFCDETLEQQVRNSIFERGEHIYGTDPEPNEFKENIMLCIARDEIRKRLGFFTEAEKYVLLRNMTNEEQRTTALLYQEIMYPEGIARELNVSKERADEIIGSVKNKIEENLGNKGSDTGITAFGFTIGLLKAYPEHVMTVVMGSQKVYEEKLREFEAKKNKAVSSDTSPATGVSESTVRSADICSTDVIDSARVNTASMNDDDIQPDIALMPEGYKHHELNTSEELLDPCSDFVVDSNNVKYRLLYLDKYYRLTTREKSISIKIIGYTGNESAIRVDKVYLDDNYSITDLLHAKYLVLRSIDENGNISNECLRFINDETEGVNHMSSYNNVFSMIYQLRIRVLLEISLSNNTVKQQVMGKIFERGRQIYDMDPAALTEDKLTDITKEEIQKLISVPTGVDPTTLLQDMSEEEQKTIILLYQENRNTEEIAEELKVSREKAETFIASVKDKIEKKLCTKDLGDGITAAGLMISMLKAQPVPVIPAAVPATVITPGITDSAPKVITAGGNTAVSSTSVSTSASQAAAVSSGNAVESSVVYTASNAGPVSTAAGSSAAVAAKTAAAAGGTAAKVAATAAVAVTVVGGGGYAGYKYYESKTNEPELAPEVITDPEMDEDINTPSPTEVVVEEAEEPVPEPIPDAEIIAEPFRRITSISCSDYSSEYIYADDTVYPSSIIRTDGPIVSTYYYTYTDDHKLKEKLLYNNYTDDEIIQAAYEYDENGYMISSVIMYDYGPEETNYTRDEEGHVVSCITRRLNDESGDEYFDVYYEYDGNKVSITDSNGQSETLIEYDDDGRIIHRHVVYHYGPEDSVNDYTYKYLSDSLVIVTVNYNGNDSDELLLLDQAGTPVMQLYSMYDYSVDEDGYPILFHEGGKDIVITYETIGE